MSITQIKPNELFLVVKLEPHVTKDEAQQLGAEICEEFSNEVLAVALHRGPDPNQIQLLLE